MSVSSQWSVEENGTHVRHIDIIIGGLFHPLDDGIIDDLIWKVNANGVLLELEAWVATARLAAEIDVFLESRGSTPVTVGGLDGDTFEEHVHVLDEPPVAARSDGLQSTTPVANNSKRVLECQ
jgi:hypothetical protein